MGPNMQPDLELRIRQLLWLLHGHQGLYGDDGEMQCATCGLDYKREDLERIASRLELIRMLARAVPNYAGLDGTQTESRAKPPVCKGNQ